MFSVERKKSFVKSRNLFHEGATTDNATQVVKLNEEEEKKNIVRTVRTVLLSSNIVFKSWWIKIHFLIFSLQSIRQHIS